MNCFSCLLLILSFSQALSETPVKKPLADYREFDSFSLDNGITCLVVRNNRTKVAGLSVGVKVGSFSDPSKFEGLAHFLEHMLFLGSKPYPDSQEFDKFVSSNGGSSNAFTGYDNVSIP
eukprot:GHVN01019352.1.p1 GENE.GHVN01019352.1~~GHVN01019352.1.p1  ORF type:complete len:119 (+),score=5.89 GHVN01019352.1:144-500(+)